MSLEATLSSLWFHSTLWIPWSLASAGSTCKDRARALETRVLVPATSEAGGHEPGPHSHTALQYWQQEGTADWSRKRNQVVAGISRRLEPGSGVCCWVWCLKSHWRASGIDTMTVAVKLSSPSQLRDPGLASRTGLHAARPPAVAASWKAASQPTRPPAYFAPFLSLDVTNFGLPSPQQGGGAWLAGPRSSALTLAARDSGKMRVCPSPLFTAGGGLAS